MKNKKAISLIVLVITIIAMLVLASAVIITLSNSNIITKSKEAVNKSDAKNFAEELSLTLADMKLKDSTYGFDEANAALVADMQKYIPDFTEKYYGKLIVQNGDLAYVKGNVTEEEKLMFESVGIKPGSYITVEKAREIKELAENTTIDVAVSSTEVATYIPGIQEEYIDMFTIFQGNLYYRYDKTSLDERVSLHSAGIPFLIGDVNEDGLLTNEDADEILQWVGNIELVSSDTFYYVADADYNGLLNGNDTPKIKQIIAGSLDIADYTTSEQQDPIKVNMLGTYIKIYRTKHKLDSENENNYKKIQECNKYLTAKEAKRLVVINNIPVYRYEKLTEAERQIKGFAGTRYIYSIGDGNFDGMVDSKDVELLMGFVGGKTPTDMQKVVLDVNGDGNLNASDYGTLSQFVGGGITYQSMLTTYSNNKDAE